MPPTALDQIVARVSPTQLVAWSDIVQCLSDALLSFSPLATLVGAESNRALAHRITNFKQSLVGSLAPIGALGMMATACKGAYLPGLKEMLGVGDEDVRDAARATGCWTLTGGAVPSMDKHGGLTILANGKGAEHAASAVVRLKWNTGHKESLDLAALRRVVTTFTSATMTGRVFWRLDATLERSAREQMIEEVRENLLRSKIGSGLGVFEAMARLEGGEGMIELHWPVPAMPLEVKPVLIYLYIGVFGLSFLAVAILVASHPLSWQSPLSSALLLGGQVVLALGHSLTRSIVQNQRKTLEVQIPRVGLGKQWMMVDRTRFPSAVAQRPYPFSNFLPDHVILSQHHSLKGNFVVWWQAVLALTALVVGFIAFYVGGKSSDVKTVLVFIALFILANLLKGPIILHANKPEHTHLKNIGLQANIWRPTSESKYSGEFRIYSSFVTHDPGTMSLFCFSGFDEWVIAAHAIRHAAPKSINYTPHEMLLAIPVYKYHPSEIECCGVLQLAIGKIKPADLFWTLGMEVGMILSNRDYCLTDLCSETCEETSISLLAGFVYTCTHMLLSSNTDCDAAPSEIQQSGAGNLWAAIDYITNSTQNPQDTKSSIFINAQLDMAARAAANAIGVKVETSEDLGTWEVALKVKQLEELDKWLYRFDQWQCCRNERGDEQKELKALLAKDSVDILLHELVKNVAKIKPQPQWQEKSCALKKHHMVAMIPFHIILQMPLVFLTAVCLMTKKETAEKIEQEDIRLGLTGMVFVGLCLTIALLERWSLPTGYVVLYMLAMVCMPSVLVVLVLQLASQLPSWLLPPGLPLPRNQQLILRLWSLHQLLKLWLWLMSLWLLHIPSPAILQSTIKDLWLSKQAQKEMLEQLELLDRWLWQWLPWKRQQPLWWKEDKLRLQLAMHQLIADQLQVFADNWQDLQADELQTEESLFQGLKQRVESVRTHLKVMKDRMISQGNLQSSGEGSGLASMSLNG